MALPPWAAPYVGLPFAQHGRTRAGVDCYGLLMLVLGEVFHVELPAYKYAHEQDWGSIAAAVRQGQRDWVPVDDHDVRPGDGIVLRMRGLPLHVGVIVDTNPLTMLHVLRGVETCCQRLDNPVWKPRVVGIYRWTPH